MANVDLGQARSYRDRRRADRREYWLIFCLSYPLLLAAVIVGRAVALFGPARSGPSQGRRSVFAEAREIAASCIPFALR